METGRHTTGIRQRRYGEETRKETRDKERLDVLRERLAQDEKGVTRHGDHKYGFSSVHLAPRAPE